MDRQILYKSSPQYYENNKKKLLDSGYKITYDDKLKTEFCKMDLKLDKK